MDHRLRHHHVLHCRNGLFNLASRQTEFRLEIRLCHPAGLHLVRRPCPDLADMQVRQGRNSEIPVPARIHRLCAAAHPAGFAFPGDSVPDACGDTAGIRYLANDHHVRRTRDGLRGGEGRDGDVSGLGASDIETEGNPACRQARGFRMAALSVNRGGQGNVLRRCPDGHRLPS